MSEKNTNKSNYLKYFGYLFLAIIGAKYIPAYFVRQNMEAEIKDKNEKAEEISRAWNEAGLNLYNQGLIKFEDYRISFPTKDQVYDQYYYESKYKRVTGTVINKSKYEIGYLGIKLQLVDPIKQMVYEEDTVYIYVNVPPNQFRKFDTSHNLQGIPSNINEDVKSNIEEIYIKRP